ncbi:MAG TPA: VWA domain-containing protein [Myxococcota bacterium]|nr:VWA domain-containing protein [Myxococcota bacterium]
MQRWQLTAGLGVIAALAAVLAPTLKASVTNAPETMEVGPHLTEIELPTSPVTVEQGNLTLTAGLDHPAVLDGRTQDRLLVITVGADDLDEGLDRPVNVAVVMDRSGSMQAKGKMEYAKTAARELVESLDADDRFSLVTFSDRAELVVASQTISDSAYLLRTINGVREGGGTNLYEGLRSGLTQVRSYSGDDQVNRVIVLSDGKANVGVTSASSLSSLAGQYNDEGIRVSTIGLGLDYNEDLLAAMADRGGGTYRFVNDPDVLTTVFREELHQMNQVAASGVSIDVRLPGAELVEVYGYDEQFVDGGFRVWLGDVYGGQTRKIVAKVRVSGVGVGSELTASTVTLSESGAVASYVEPVEVKAQVVASQQTVDMTVNRELAVLGNFAAAGQLADDAAQAYALGDRDRSEELLEASNLVAGEAASRYDSNRLRQQSAELIVQTEDYQAEPSSDEGRYAVKKNKEANRGWYY